MTLVTVDLRRPDADGEYVAVRGAVEWVPTRRRHVDSHVVLPQPFRHEASAPVTVDVAPTGPDWCWQVKELTSTGITRHVMVPDVSGPIPYTSLVDVDPATLDPVAEPEAAWWAALTDYREETGTARDEAVAAAVGAAGSADAADLSASAAAASEGLAGGHASDASGSAGSAASSASAASGSAVAAAGSESAAAGHATDAQSALDLTVEARDLTLGYRDTAAGHATTATTQAGLAATARIGAEDARDLAIAAGGWQTWAVGRPDFPATTPYTQAQLNALPVGYEYISTNRPQGARRWIKTGAAGATAWECVEGDTGVVDALSVIGEGWSATSLTLHRVGPICYIKGQSLRREEGAGITFLRLPTGFQQVGDIFTPLILRRGAGALIGVRDGAIYASSFATLNALADGVEINSLPPTPFPAAKAWPTSLTF